MRRTVKPLEERFWTKVDQSGECWLWTGAMMITGYGVINRGYGQGIALAHRVSWELANGRAIPSGHVICHRCDVRACVRPDHLFLGTQADNLRDASEKGRMAGPKRPRGETHWNARITDEQVRAMWTRILAGEGDKSIAADFGVDRSYIYLLRTTDFRSSARPQ